MSIRIKYGQGESQVEFLQMHQRLEALGLKVEGGIIEERSANNVRGGLEAIKALAKDGVLDSDGLARLRLNTGWIKQAIGRDLPISAQHTQRWRSVALECDGARKTMEGAISQINFESAIDNPLLVRVAQRLENLSKKANQLIFKDFGPTSLAQVDPAMIGTVITSVVALAQTSAVYQAHLSKFRQAALKSNPDGWWSGMQLKAIIHNLRVSKESNEQIQKFSDFLSKPTLFGNQSLALAQSAASGALSSEGTIAISATFDRLAATTKLSREDLADGLRSFVARHFVEARGDAANEILLLATQGLGKPVGTLETGPQYYKTVISAVEAAAKRFPNDPKAFQQAMSG